MGELFIKEYVPEEEIPYTEYEDSPWEYSFYDPELQMIFRIFIEPDWIKLEDGKTYEFTFETYNDEDGYNYRVWKRLNENKVIIAEWYDKWYTIDERYIGTYDRRNVDDVIKEYITFDNKNKTIEINRADIIQKWINSRVEDNETRNCLFEFLLLKNDCREKLETLLSKYDKQTPCACYDTVDGCWNLDDRWYELTDIEAIVEYCGVYPVKWDIEDVVLLEEMYNNREIYINVQWKVEDEDGSINYIPNH